MNVDFLELAPLGGADLGAVLDAVEAFAGADLHNYATGEYLRPATPAETLESIAAGVEGAFEAADGVTCYVIAPGLV